jgi:hypothetical protein
LIEAIRLSSWAYPLLEVIHLAGVALLLGNLLLLELRLFGAAPELPVKALARLGLALVALGFTLAAASGLLMFATQAQELLANRAFVWKMGLMSLAACNAAAFHGRDGLARGDLVAKLQMGLSTLLWLAVLACGRWIAYL